MTPDYGTKYTDAELIKLEKELRSVYKQAREEIIGKMESFNRRHEALDKKYFGMVQSGKMSLGEYTKWLEGQVFIGEQWRNKQKQIADVLFDSNKVALDIITRHSFNVFAENANYQSYELEHGAGINFGFGLYDSSTVARLIKDNPRILPPKKLKKGKDKAWNMKNMRSALTQGIIQGESIDKVAKRFADVTASRNMKSMVTHARTSMTAAQNAGRYESLLRAKKMGLNVIKGWMATLDYRTRDSHAHLDGEKQKVGDLWHPHKFSNGLRYPGDPDGPPAEVYNCRCTLVGDVLDYPAEYERYDQLNGKVIKNMTYREWFKNKSLIKAPEFNQVGIGMCKTVQEVNNLLNTPGLFRSTLNYTSKADLTGCDLDSAKAIASSYEQVFSKYPQLKGKFDAPDANPTGMRNNTYAWSYIRTGGKVQVNPSKDKFGNWASIVRSYEDDVLSGFHPYGTTAESIVVHEIGHSIDGLLAREGISGGITASGQYRYASSTMRNTVMKRASKKDPVMAQMFEIWGGKEGMSMAVGDYVSRYATHDAQEWFAECFAEYITSANPRLVATEFGKELEKLLRKLK